MQKKVSTILFVIAIVSILAVAPQLETVDAKKSQGTYNQKYGSATKNIVCGDRLCSEINDEKYNPLQTKQVKTTKSCSNSSIQFEKECVSFNIEGATVKSSVYNDDTSSSIIKLESLDDGKMQINSSKIQERIFMVLVDGQEWNDVFVDDTGIAIQFFAGTETIEMFGN